jgi:hypothetical protein
MIKKLVVTLAAAGALSMAMPGSASAGPPTMSTEKLAQLAQSVPDATARVPGVPTTFTLVAERYFTQDGKCAVERTYVWSDEYGLFRHHTKAYWC